MVNVSMHLLGSSSTAWECQRLVRTSRDRTAGWISYGQKSKA